MGTTSKYIDTTVVIHGREVPVRIHIERRNSMRASIGKRHVNLRIPRGIIQTNIDKGLEWLRQWLMGLSGERKGLLDRISIKTYHSGQVLKVGQRSYQLHISYEKRNSHTARLLEGTIYLRLVEDTPPAQLQRAIKTLLSRVVGNDFLLEIHQRVYYWNDRHFNQNVKNIRLKYTTSNWGSCSTKGNINLSTRLLFAPQAVIDYVIVHELAHFLEHNHSPAFWKIVADVMPDYQKKEVWLKENGYLCDF